MSFFIMTTTKFHQLVTRTGIISLAALAVIGMSTMPSGQVTSKTQS